MKTIYFVRHLEYLNPENLNPGINIHVDLDPSAIDKFQQDIEFFDGKDISQIVSSQVQRAQDTAKLLKKKININISTDKNLSENYMPTFEGMRWDDMFEKLNGSSIYVDRDHIDAKGESYFDILSRMKESTLALEDKSIAISHGDPMGILLSYLQKKKLDPSLWIENQFADYPPRGSITEIIIDEELDLKKFEKINY